MASLRSPLLSGEFESNHETDPFNKKIEIDNGRHRLILTLAEKLGEGAFGSVFKAEDERGKIFAIKIMNCETPENKEVVAQEIDILTGLEHDNIVRMYAFDFLDSLAVVVMEYCGLGTLNSRLEKPVLKDTQLVWMYQLASGLQYLHQHNIVHRDLKCENVLLQSEKILKLADFGVSRQFICCRRNCYDWDDGAYVSEYLNSFMGTFAGTPFWVAPEVFDLNYNEAADIFSLGGIFHAILERQFTEFQHIKYFGLFQPYGNEERGIGLIMSETKREVVPEFKQQHDKLLISLVKGMVRMDPKKRVAINDIHSQLNMLCTENLMEEKHHGMCSCCDCSCFSWIRRRFTCKC